MDRKLVLLVDDETFILNALQRLLRCEDYDLILAEGGAQGLAILAEQEVHLVISDYLMPDMLGSEFLEEVRRLYPQTERILLTGYSDEGDLQSMTEEGLLCCIIFKPWDDEKLKQKIRDCIARYGSGSLDVSDINNTNQTG